MSTIGRRTFCLGCTLSLLAFGPSSWAGSYLDRAALLLSEGKRAMEYLRLRLGDRELARLVQKLAAARVTAGGSMQVPPEVAQAHPHLLLVLERHERAASAAMSGEHGQFLEHVQRARDEEGIFIGILKQAGWILPAV